MGKRLIETTICGDVEDVTREGHPLNDDYEVLNDTLFSPRVEQETKAALASSNHFEQAQARQLATEQVVRAAGFQDYQARAFQLGDNEPTVVVREFVQKYGWERSEDNEARRTAKRELDDAILTFIGQAIGDSPDEFWRYDQFINERNNYRIQQLLDTADRNGNFSLALQALGVPTELATYTDRGHDPEQFESSVVRAISRRLSPEGAPRKLDELSVEATEIYLDLVRLRLTDEQRRGAQRVIETRFAPEKETDDGHSDDYWLNGQRPLETEQARPVLSDDQRKLIGLVAATS